MTSLAVNVTVYTGRIQALPASVRPTAMYKVPISGPVKLDTLGLAGDHHADTRVHGGPDKAVHLYPSGHYAKLAREFPQALTLLTLGNMGENLATAELDEHQVRIGDVWQLGSAQIQVCQPRNPCWKIDDRFGAEGMAQFIDRHMLTGWYWRVLQPGVVEPIDHLRLIEPNARASSLYEAMRLWREHRPDLDALAQLADTEGMAPNWRDKIVQRIANLKNLT